MRRSTRLHRGLSAMLSTLVLGTFCLGFAPAASAEALPDFSYLGSFGSLSADDTQTAAVLIWQAFSSHLENIDLSAVTAKYTDCTEDCLGLYREIMHTAAPAVLHASNYYYSAWNGGLRIKIQYAVGADEYDALYRSSIAQINAIAAAVRPEWSDEEKALYLHDYLATMYNYDHIGLSGDADRPYRELYSAFGLLRNGAAVCQGYSELYAMLLNKVGVPARFVSSDTLNHAWNYVRIDGAWYHVDVTWDDCYQNRAGIMNHSCFLKTSQELAAIDDYNAADWELADGTNLCNVQSSSPFTDAFWNGRNNIAYWNGYWTAFDPEQSAIICYDYDSSTKCAAATKLCTLTRDQSRWQVWGKANAVWNSTFVVPVAANGALYYSTPTAIYTVKDSVPVLFHALSSEELAQGYIYGMYADAGTLRYGIDTVPQNASNLSPTIQYHSIALPDVPQETVPETTTTVTTTATTVTTTTTTVTTTTTTTMTTAVTTTVPVGSDLNGDGRHTASDAVLLLRFVTEQWDDALPMPDAAMLDAADLDRDGCLTVTDVMLWFRRI